MVKLRGEMGVCYDHWTSALEERGEGGAAWVHTFNIKSILTTLTYSWRTLFLVICTQLSLLQRNWNTCIFHTMGMPSSTHAPPPPPPPPPPYLANVLECFANGCHSALLAAGWMFLQLVMLSWPHGCYGEHRWWWLVVWSGRESWRRWLFGDSEWWSYVIWTTITVSISSHTHTLTHIHSLTYTHTHTHTRWEMADFGY